MNRKQNMKKKLNKHYIVPAVIGAVIVLVPLTLFIAYKLRFQYIKNCFYSNEQAFERLVELSRKHRPEGGGQQIIKIDEQSGGDEISQILGDLREKYQKDSDLSVFSRIRSCFDKNGNMALSITVSSKKLAGRDGINSPDVRCGVLVYIDEGFDFASTDTLHLPPEDDTPFHGSWHTWSYDTYSG
jgi:hypothetical protein